jgi:hypothetical protein
MTNESSIHLTEEELNDLLIGESASASASHLAACPSCRAKVEEFQSGLEAFNQTALSWCEMRSVTLPVPQVPAKPRHWPLATMGWAAAGLLLIMMAPIVRQTNWFHPNHGAPVITAHEGEGDTEAQIAQDNELLKAVNAAINPSEEPQLDEFGLSAKPHPRHSRGVK